MIGHPCLQKVVVLVSDVRDEPEVGYWRHRGWSG